MKLNKKIIYLVCFVLVFCTAFYLKIKSNVQLVDNNMSEQKASSVLKNDAPDADYLIQKNSVANNDIIETPQSEQVPSDYLISSLRIVGGKDVYVENPSGQITGIHDGKILNDIDGVHFIQYNNPHDSGEDDSVPDYYINEYGFEFDGFIKDLVLYADSDKENKRPISIDEFVVRGINVRFNRQITLTEKTEFVKKEIALDEYSLLVHIDEGEIASTIFYKDDPMYKK